jgi:hypothetical protein
MLDRPWWRCAKAPKSWFVSEIAWVGRWRGNGTTDWMAIIVNNHVTPDRWRGKLDFLSDRLLDAIDRMQAGEATEQDRERLELCLGEDWETLFVDE